MQQIRTRLHTCIDLLKGKHYAYAKPFKTDEYVEAIDKNLPTYIDLLKECCKFPIFCFSEEIISLFTENFFAAEPKQDINKIFRSMYDADIFYLPYDRCTVEFNLDGKNFNIEKGNMAIRA